jgi:GNAT superfamily N-acetyltransferase
MTDATGAIPALIRPAHAADLASIWQVRYRNDIAGAAAVPDSGPIPPFLPHLIATGDLLVAETGAGVVSYAGRIDRGGVAYLTDLFVDPAYQSSALGSRLLRTIFADEPYPRCTLATSDPRALALYTRAGMSPRWPNILLRGMSGNVRDLPQSDIALIEASASDPELVRRDQSVSGRLRPQDLAYFCNQERGQPFWLRRGNEPIGYAVVRLGAGRLWYPHVVTIGPMGIAAPEYANVAVSAVVQWARTQGDVLEITLPGAHPALAALLQARFTIEYVETYCASHPDIVDPLRYIGSGGDFF